jgi:hypothetical protein
VKKNQSDVMKSKRANARRRDIITPEGRKKRSYMEADMKEKFNIRKIK